MSDIEIVLKLVLAVILGGVIGLEREYRGVSAGFRTHALVCLGATLFTLMSILIAGSRVDASRIAAGIVTGIGFLGAGAIFQSKDRVRGLTTAADLWVVGAAGIAIALGYYIAAITAIVLVLLMLILGRYFKERNLKRKESY